MSPLVGTIIIFALLFLAVYISNKTKINMGLIALVFALLLGCIVLRMGAGAVFARFPTTLTMTFILGPMFFGYVRRAAVFEKLSQNIVYALRGVPALFPFTVFLAAAIVTAFGGGLITGFIIGSFAYAICMKLRQNPVLVAVALWSGCIVFPWLDTSSVPRGLLEQINPAIVDHGMFALMMASLFQHLIFLVIVYFIYGGYKADASEVKFVKAEPYTEKEKKVLGILIVFIAMAAIPSIIQVFYKNPVTAFMSTYLNIYVLFSIGIIIFWFMDIEKPDVVVKEDIPWNMIILLVGSSMLMGLLNDVGTIDLVAQAVSGLDVSLNVFMAIMAFCGGLITVFSNGLVAAQTLLPIVIAVAEGTGMPILPLFNAMYTGTNGPNLSPFSGLGANCIVMCPNEYKDTVSKQIFIGSFGVLILQTVLGLLGMWSWFC